MGGLPESAPDAIKSAPSQDQRTGYSRSIHPNVSLTRALAPDFNYQTNNYTEPEHSRVSTATSVATQYGTTPHPNISRMAGQQSASQQTAWTHPNIQSNRSKRYSRFPQPVRNTNSCNSSRQQCPAPAQDQSNSSSSPLTSGSSCSQSSQTNPGYKNCPRFTPNRNSRPKTGGSGGRIRPKTSRASRKKSLRQLKVPAPCDSSNVCDNCKASMAKLSSKSSSCIPRASQTATILAKSKSSCMSMDICSDCREAHAVSSTGSCQSSAICEHCGASKRTSGRSSSELPSCDSDGDCSDCAGTHRTVPSCQSMTVCSQCRAAGKTPSRTTLHHSTHSRSNLQIGSSAKFTSAPSRDLTRICGDCARKCAADPCSSISICKNCSRPFTPPRSTLQNVSFGSLGRQQHGCSAHRSKNASKKSGQGSCASCGSKLTAPAKPSCCNAGSKVSKPQEDCDCQHSDTDLRPKKSDRSLNKKPSTMSQSTQKSASASRCTQTEAAEEDDFECQSKNFCDECGGLPDCNDLPSSDDEKQANSLRSRPRSKSKSAGKQRGMKSPSSRRSMTPNPSSRRAKSPMPCSKRSNSTNLPGPCGQLQDRSTTSASVAKCRCQVKSTNPCEGLRGDEHPCGATKRQLSTKCLKQKQQDEAKVENPCAKLRENRQPSLKEQQKGEKKCKVLEKVTKSCPEPASYETTGEKKLLHLKSKSKDDNEFQCDENPCELIDAARAQSEQKVLQQRAECIRKEKAKKAEFDAFLMESVKEDPKEPKPDECPGTDNDCAAIERRLKPKKFSKKYQRMRYEIELQNFIIDKINRQLKMKVKRCCPQTELRALKQSLDREVEKLREMVQFAIGMQRGNQEEVWGPIPISKQSKTDLSEMKTCNDQNAMKPPQKPSRISQLSGFDELDDIMYGCGLEPTSPDSENQEEERNCCQPQVMRCEEEIKCEELFPEPAECPRSSVKHCAKSQKVQNCSDDDVEKELMSVTNSIKNLMSNVARMECKIKTLKNDFSTLKQGKAIKNKKCC